jgi:hypothetical protein
MTTGHIRFSFDTVVRDADLELKCTVSESLPWFSSSNEVPGYSWSIKSPIQKYTRTARVAPIQDVWCGSICTDR